MPTQTITPAEGNTKNLDEQPPSYCTLDEISPESNNARQVLPAMKSSLTSVDLRQPVDKYSRVIPRDDCNDQQSSEPQAEQQVTFVQRLANRIPCLGILFALCASFFLGTAGMLVKVTTSVNGIQVAVFRAMIQLVVYTSILKLRKLSWKPDKGEFCPVMGRALLGASSITFSYYALKLIPLSDATTIRFSLPIWTLIISYLVLNESCNLFKISAVIISVSGVVLIAKPDYCMHLLDLIMRSLSPESPGQEIFNSTGNFTPDPMVDEDNLLVLPPDTLLLDDGLGHEIVEIEPKLESEVISATQQLEGSLLALASSICLSLSLISTRLCKTTPSEVIVLWLSILSIIIGTITLILIGQWKLPDNILDVLLIILNGACGSIGQWFITNALKVEQSGVIALARTFDIEIAFFYSVILLHEQIQATSIVGSILVSSGVIAVVLPNWLNSRKVKQQDV